MVGAFLFVYLLVFGAYAQELATQSGSNVIELPELVVEESAPILAPNTTDAERERLSFTGTKVSPILENPLAIPLRSMEFSYIPSAWWRTDAWELAPQYSNVYEQRSVRLRASRISSLRVRQSVRKHETTYEVQLGGRKALGGNSFWDNQNTPLDPTDDKPSIQDSQLRSIAGALTLQQSNWAGTLAWDVDHKQTYLGSVVSGVRRQRAGDLAAKFEIARISFTPFAQWMEQKFSAAKAFSTSSEAQETRFGLSVEMPVVPNWSGEIRLDRGIHRRSVVTDSTQVFTETSANASLETPSNFAFGPVDLKVAIGGAWNQVTEDNLSQNSSLSWRALLSGRTNFSANFGMAGAVERFAELPRPSELFGDTALIKPNLELAPYTGIRGAVGPWYEWQETLSGTAEFIWERGSGEKVTIVSFPLARTEAIGGTYMRGYRLRQNIFLGDNIGLSGEFTHQEAINASEIIWQRGNPIPGRPLREWRITGTYHRGYWKTEAYVRASSGEAIDLIGTLYKQPNYDLGVSLAWQDRSLLVRAYGRNLLARVAQASDFSATNPAAILEPEIPQQTFGLDLEVKL